MSYNIDEFVVYGVKGKVRLPKDYQELVESGYYPPHYNDSFEAWICDKSKGTKLVVYVDGDYGQFAQLYKDGKKVGKDVSIERKGKDYIKTMLKDNL